MSDYLSQEWRTWESAHLEREYSPSAWAKRLYADYVPSFVAGSELSRIRLGEALRRDSYGVRDKEFIDWVPPSDNKEMFLWFHGGYWQGSSVAEAMMGAESIVESGYGFAAIEYTLAPEMAVAGIIEECLAATSWLRRQLPDTRFVIGGHSAGAHLALMVAKRFAASGLVLVSGVFDLRPLVPTSVNDPLFLTDSEAWSLSPLSSSFSGHLAAEIIVGGEESPSFIAQSKAARDYLLANGCQAAYRIIGGRDHFDIITEQEHITSFLGLVSA